MKPSIKLKIKKPGYMITIPGLPEFRTPAVVDISKITLHHVIITLKNSGVEDYEIVSETKNRTQVYTKKDLDKKKIKKTSDNKDKLIDRLCCMVDVIQSLKLIGNTGQSEEQIINKLDNLEKLVVKSLKTPIVVREQGEFIEGDTAIEELDSFIPEIEISDMKISSDNIKIIKQEEDAETSADALADLIKK